MIIFAKDEDEVLVIPVGLGPNVSEAQCPEPVLEDITLDSSTQGQTVTPDEGVDGFSGVTVNPYTTEARTAGITTNGTFTYSPVNADALSEVTVNVSVNTVRNQSKTADSSTVSQSITPDNGYTGLSSVTVNPYTLDSKTVDPSTSQVTVNSSADGLSSVTVNAVDASIDVNIQAENIKDGVTILGVTGNYTGGGSGNDWLVDALAGNITDLSGYTLPEPTRNYQYAQLFCAYPITNTVDMSNWTSITGNYTCYNMFQDCTSITSVDLSSLTELSGSYSCYNLFNGCSSLKSVNLSSLTRFNTNGLESIFKNCYAIDTLICHPNLYSGYTSKTIITSFGRIVNLTFTALTEERTNVDLSREYLLSADSVYSVLTHLNPNIVLGHNPVCTFYQYSGGLTVTDYPDGRIQTAYDAAVAAGWTISNLTITPYQ